MGAEKSKNRPQFNANSSECLCHTCAKHRNMLSQKKETSNQDGLSFKSLCIESLDSDESSRYDRHVASTIYKLKEISNSAYLRFDKEDVNELGENLTSEEVLFCAVEIVSTLMHIDSKKVDSVPARVQAYIDLGTEKLIKWINSFKVSKYTNSATQTDVLSNESVSTFKVTSHQEKEECLNFNGNDCDSLLEEVSQDVKSDNNRAVLVCEECADIITLYNEDEEFSVDMHCQKGTHLTAAPTNPRSVKDDVEDHSLEEVKSNQLKSTNLTEITTERVSDKSDCEMPKSKTKTPQEKFQERVDAMGESKYVLIKNDRKVTCEICKVSSDLSNSFIQHLQGKKHLKNKNAVPLNIEVKSVPSNSMTTVKNSTPSNNTVISNASTSVSVQSSNIPLPEAVINIYKSRETLENTIRENYNELEQQKSDLKISEVFKMLGTHLSTIRKKYFLEVFGSRAFGLASSNSDVDVFVELGPGNPALMCIEVYKLLRSCTNYTNVECIENARVPVVKLIDKSTGLACDLSFWPGLGVHNSRLIRCMIGLDPRVRDILLSTKLWLRSSSIPSGKNGMTSYAFLLMVVFYLQQVSPPVLPSITYLQTLPHVQRLYVSGWDCSVPQSNMCFWTSKNEDSIEVLLRGFFEFYATFDFATLVICPSLGRPLSRSLFSRRGVVAPECTRPLLSIYLEAMWRNEVRVMKHTEPICVQDPIEMSHNVCKGVPRALLTKFVTYCSHTAKLMKSDW